MEKVTQRRRHIALLFILVYLISSIFLTLPASAKEEKDEFGWVEVRATVPGGFDGEIYVLLENQETFNTYDFFIVAVNNFVDSEKIPAGDYVVSFAYVYQNSNYKVTVDTEKVTVSSEGAATVLNATVTSRNNNTPNVIATPELPEVTETPDVEPGDVTGTPEPSPDVSAEPDVSPEVTPDESLVVAPTPSATPTVTDDQTSADNEVENEDVPSESNEISETITTLITNLIGSIIFVAVVFGVVYWVRQRTQN